MTMFHDADLYMLFHLGLLAFPFSVSGWHALIDACRWATRRATASYSARDVPSTLADLSTNHTVGCEPELVASH